MEVHKKQIILNFLIEMALRTRSALIISLNKGLLEKKWSKSLLSARLNFRRGALSWQYQLSFRSTGNQ